jgi:CheY-like chemotaxis protein
MIYVVVMSGDDLEEVSRSCLCAGADDVYGKPMSPSELRRRLMAAAPEGKTLPVAS